MKTHRQILSAFARTNPSPIVVLSGQIAGGFQNVAEAEADMQPGDALYVNGAMHIKVRLLNARSAISEVWMEGNCAIRMIAIGGAESCGLFAKAEAKALASACGANVTAEQRLDGEWVVRVPAVAYETSADRRARHSRGAYGNPFDLGRELRPKVASVMDTEAF